MKTTIRFYRTVPAIFKLAALFSLIFVFSGCKEETASSARKALVRTTGVESTENVRSDSEASYLTQVRAEKWPEPRIVRADTAEKLIAIENRTEIAAMEGEERSLVEGIITAKARSVTALSEKRKQAERAFELASQRYNAGTGSRIDMLNAQTALIKARCSYVDALHDYWVATLSGDTARTLNAETNTHQ
jgi:hypothetical protein